MTPPAYNAQVSPISPHFTPGPSNQASPMQSMAGVLRQNPQITPNPLENTYGLSIFDPNDPMQYNFDPANFNFGNYYGALEFGMLDHMSFGVVETAFDDVTESLPAPVAGYTTPGAMSEGYDGSPAEIQYRRRLCRGKRSDPKRDEWATTFQKEPCRWARGDPSAGRKRRQGGMQLLLDREARRF